MWDVEVMNNVLWVTEAKEHKLRESTFSELDEQRLGNSALRERGYYGRLH